MQDKIHPNAAVEQRIRRLLAQIHAQVHPLIVEQATGLLDVGEYRVAVENLCELLCEDQVSLTRASYDELLDIVRAIGVEERYCAILPPPPPTAN